MSFVPAKKVAADDIARLQAFLTSDHLPEGTLNLAQLRGFLWAVASSPTRLGATDWMPVVWGEGEEGAEPVEIFRSAEEAQSVIPVILYLYQQAAQQAESGDLRLPADATYDDANGVSPELAGWCQGFLLGHDWLEEPWTELAEVRPDVASELTRLVAFPALFADTEASLAASKEPAMLKAGMGDVFEVMLVPALNAYAALGRDSARVERLVEQSAKPKTGRNDPCPCGSGKKFKKCCGA